MKKLFCLAILSCLCLYLFACGDEDKSGILLPGPENVNTTTIDGVTYSIEKDYAAVTGCDPLEEVIIRSEVEINGEKYTVKALGKEYNDEYGLTFPSSVQSIHIPPTIVWCRINVFSDSKIRELYLESLQSWCAIYFTVTTHVGSGGTDLWMYANPITENTEIYVNGQPIVDLVIPNGVKSISDYAFRKFKTPSLTLNEDLESIGDNAFEECANLKSVEFNGNLKSIGAFAFNKDANLSRINLPESLEELGFASFKDCQGIKEVRFSPNCRIIPMNSFWGTAIEVLELPEGVEQIDQTAFYKCSNLTRIVLPSTIRQIGSLDYGPWYGVEANYWIDFVFTGCDRLTEVYVLNPVPPVLTTPDAFGNESYGFRNFPDSMLENGTLYVPLESVDAYKADYNWGHFKNIVGMDFSGVESVSTDGVNNSQNSGLYDLNGHKVRDENPPHGIYIQNGKKIVR